MNLGLGIKQIRKSKGISQGELAEKIGLSPASMSMIENGVKRPTSKNLKKICDVLGVPEALIYLYTLEDSDIPKSKKEIYHTYYPYVKDMLTKIIEK